MVDFDFNCVEFFFGFGVIYVVVLLDEDWCE